MKNNNKELIKRIKQSLIILAFPVITFLVLSPLEIYAGNQSEFLFGYNAFLWSFLMLAVGILVVGAALLAFIPEKVSGIIKLMIFAGTFTAYIQNMFLNKKLMKTDGSKIDWSEYKDYTKLNLIVWVLLLLIIITMPIWLKKLWKKVMEYTSIGIAAIQIFAVISLLITLPYNTSNERVVALSGEGEFSLAPNNNIIVLVLDRYANIPFENGPDADPNFYDIYADFTYYNNYNSSYNYTFPSMTYMMTHVVPDCDITTKEYKTSAWDKGISKDFHDKLASNGYIYNFYTQSGKHIYYDAAYLEGSIDNIVDVEKEDINIKKSSIFELFTKMTVYKYSPYIVKPYLETQSIVFNGLVTYDGVPLCYESNSGYYETLLGEGLNIDPSLNNALIIQQLSGIHTPYTMNADGSECEENDTNMTECQLGINVMLEEYFNQLKRLNLYDDATIILMADHGQGFEVYCPQPIFLIKRPNEKHNQMVVSNAPISSEDFLATVLDIIGEEYDKTEYGTSIFEWKDNDKRERFSAYPDNGFNVYTYIGSEGDLIDKMKNNDCTRIEATEDWD